MDDFMKQDEWELLNKATLDELAKVLHESGREAVAKRLVYRNDLPVKPFCEWAELPEDAKEGRRLMARYLREHAARVIELL